MCPGCPGHFYTCLWKAVLGLCTKLRNSACASIYIYMCVSESNTIGKSLVLMFRWQFARHMWCCVEAVHRDHGVDALRGCAEI